MADIALTLWALAREVSDLKLSQPVLLRTPPFTAQGGHEHTFLLGHTWECVKLLGAGAQGLLGGAGSTPACTPLAGCSPGLWA